MSEDLKKRFTQSTSKQLKRFFKKNRNNGKSKKGFGIATFSAYLSSQYIWLFLQKPRVTLRQEICPCEQIHLTCQKRHSSIFRKKTVIIYFGDPLHIWDLPRFSLGLIGCSQDTGRLFHYPDQQVINVVLQLPNMSIFLSHHLFLLDELLHNFFKREIAVGRHIRLRMFRLLDVRNNTWHVILKCN